jgi:hypothetical protein
MLRRSSLVECVSALHGTCLQCLQCAEQKYIHQYVNPGEENPRCTFLTIKRSLLSHTSSLQKNLSNAFKAKIAPMTIILGAITIFSNYLPKADFLNVLVLRLVCLKMFNSNHRNLPQL